MRNNISILDPQKCTACSSCYNACSFQAITMEENAEGFMVPVIHAESCTECGICIKSCPVLNVKKSRKAEPELYAVRASDEIRAVSSSGGLFTVLAEEILSRGGTVCGAAYDETMRLRHILVTSPENLAPLRGSKYVQSEIGTVYRDIRALLNAGKPVLFTGTPCQAAGLRTYLRKEYEQLYVMDVLCHGVPSQKLFRQYLKETMGAQKVTDVRFRDNRFGWSCEHIVVETQDGNTYTADSKNDPYLRGFLCNLTLRTSCGDCPFCEFPRQGDISAGDFWGISKIDRSQYDGKGTSLVYVNTAKGRELFEAVRERLKVKQFDGSALTISNRIKAYYPMNPNRYRLFKFLENGRVSFKNAVPKALSRQFDIGIVSNYFAENFGGSLTQYALYHTLEDMGYSCLMIERPEDAKDKASLESIKHIYKEIPYPEAAMAQQRKTKAEMEDLNRFCSTFVVGSDQLFQFGLYQKLGKYVTLDWVTDDHKKIAYAASFGHDKIWGDKAEIAKMGYYMRKFDAFSVREESGVSLTKRVFDVDSVQVLDPVFLCDRKHYDALIAKSQRKLSRHVIGSYILDPSLDKAAIIRTIQKKLGIKAQIFSEFNHSEEYVKSLAGLDVQHLTVEERLQLISECDFFVTDSFHGTCLAIIMQKPFVTILNEDRGGSRFYSLLSLLGLKDRLILNSGDLDGNTVIFQPIHYEKVNKVLHEERNRSIGWLKNALTAEKIMKYTEFDVLSMMIQEQQKKIQVMEKQIQRLALVSDYGFIAQTDIHGYLNALDARKQDLLILIAVKDTPGMSLSKEVAEEMRHLGVRSDLCGQHWKSYAAVLDGGHLEFEELSDAMIEKRFRLCGMDVTLKSAGFKVGNTTKIIVNGEEYSVNRRGFNFVILDKASGQVLDAVCFDLHTRTYFCHRA